MLARIKKEDRIIISEECGSGGVPCDPGESCAIAREHRAVLFDDAWELPEDSVQVPHRADRRECGQAASHRYTNHAVRRAARPRFPDRPRKMLQLHSDAREQERIHGQQKALAGLEMPDQQDRCVASRKPVVRCYAALAGEAHGADDRANSEKAPEMHARRRVRAVKDQQASGTRADSSQVFPHHQRQVAPTDVVNLVAEVVGVVERNNVAGVTHVLLRPEHPPNNRRQHGTEQNQGRPEFFP